MSKYDSEAAKLLKLIEEAQETEMVDDYVDVCCHAIRKFLDQNRAFDVRFMEWMLNNTAMVALQFDNNPIKAKEYWLANVHTES